MLGRIELEPPFDSGGQEPEGAEDGGVNVSSSPAHRSESPPVGLETITLRGDVIAGAICLITALAGYFIVVPAWVYIPAQFKGTINSPALMPQALFILMGLFSAVYLLRSIDKYRRSDRQALAPLSDWALAAGTILICLAYLGAIYVVGFPVASALCLVVAQYYFGERRWGVILAIAILLPGLLWLFFVKIALIVLPTPMIPFLDFADLVGALEGVFETAAFFEGGFTV
ncbi:MAG: tripartite tricarboxylate transporter TctB family protein [Proteobacteria bacterium]|nr:tripartite tricarboxylate transporter TctB family protein [Pseudomonadota bacterium]